MQPYDERKKFGKTPVALMLAGKHQYVYAKTIIGDGSVLDVGAGFCALKDYLPEGADYEAIDGTEWVAKEGGAKYCLLADYKGARRDYVCLFGTLETATNLSDHAKQAKSFAKKAVLGSFSVKCIEPFKALTKEDISKAFGVCIFEKEINNEILFKCIV